MLVVPRFTRFSVYMHGKTHPQFNVEFLGEKLRFLLRTHKTMESVNVYLERTSVQENREGVDGGWHTEGSLLLLPGWTEWLS